MQEAVDDVALDEAALLLGAVAEGCGGEAVEVAEHAVGAFVQAGDRVVLQQTGVGAGLFEAQCEVGGGVLGGERTDLEAVVDA